MASKFILLGGTYTDGGGVRHVFERDRETLVLSDEPLDEKHRGMFRRAGGPEPVAGPPAAAITATSFIGPPPTVRTADPPSQQEAAADPADGIDLTVEYPEAQRNSLKVFRRTARLFVTPEDAPLKPIHGGAGFTTPAQARRCINQFAALQTTSGRTRE